MLRLGRRLRSGRMFRCECERRIVMSETTDKPKLGMRAPLGLTRTVETGKVKQSFSHGRSNTVVVETKRRRVLTRPGEAPQVEAAPEPEVVVEAPKPAPRVEQAPP